jgi:hypothetical protein
MKYFGIAERMHMIYKALYRPGVTRVDLKGSLERKMTYTFGRDPYMTYYIYHITRTTPEGKRTVTVEVKMAGRYQYLIYTEAHTNVEAALNQREAIKIIKKLFGDEDELSA